jgi:NAD(P)-dependent dehydrogenase (short-subunit alcohol dehydrogenase family)
MESQVFAVTGATGAIGAAIATRLAAEAHHEVVVIARNPEKSRRLVERMRRATGNPRVRDERCDVSRKREVQALAERWEGPLHVLINNAAIAPQRRETTPEGIELQLATNVLSYFWLSQALTPVLAASAPARIVNVASYWAGELDLDDLEFIRRRYDNDTAYRQSKQANRMLTVAFAERLAPQNIAVHSCHPGDVRSQLSRDLGFGGHESAEAAAETPVWLALAPTGQPRTGAYFRDGEEAPCPFARDRDSIEKLYAICAGY